MSLTKITRHRAPLDGSWFKTTANLSGVLRAVSLYDDNMTWPMFANDAVVPVFLSMRKYQAQVARQRPDGMMFGPAMRLGTMESPEVEMFGHHHSAGLFYDYRLDPHDGDSKWMYRPYGYDAATPPGEDVSVYRCDKCNENLYRDDLGDRSHYSACLQDGSLVCRDCEYIGLVADGDAKDQLSRCRGLAKFLSHGHLAQFERNIERLSGGFSFGTPCQTRIWREDKYSFNWLNTIFSPEGKRRGMNGGLILHGPHAEPSYTGYEFTTWDYKENKTRTATAEEVGGIHWSIHT